MLHKGLSITPASILEVINIVKEQEIDPSVYVLEESLGTTGTGEMGILTTLTPDYRIASDSKWASEAKWQIMNHPVVIMNHQDTSLIEDNTKTEIITFASGNQNADLISGYPEKLSVSYLMGKPSTANSNQVTILKNIQLLLPPAHVPACGQEQTRTT
ncbi:hypothetical protein [Methanohalophilus profundi]|uniref:hypothetical protein n=1 Tax=Methanohalophilus profundi TaxID=2138083 RepID=UPI00101CCB66|nr:hypothetical protein [Methanohalophilus profundi]